MFADLGCRAKDSLRIRMWGWGLRIEELLGFGVEAPFRLKIPEELLDVTVRFLKIPEKLLGVTVRSLKIPQQLLVGRHGAHGRSLRSFWASRRAPSKKSMTSFWASWWAS